MTKIGDKEYNVEINKMFLKPHFVVNGMTTDINIWVDTVDADESHRLLLLAIKCYEYNKANGTIKNGYFYIHDSEKVEEVLVTKHKKSGGHLLIKLL